MSSQPELELLRSELHRAIDDAIDKVAGRSPASADTSPVGPVAAVLRRLPDRDAGPHPYQWPKNVEHFERGSWYEARFDANAVIVRVSWTERACWGKDDRRRAIVFGFVRGDLPSRPEPFAEFVETDESPPRFAASIRRPGDGGKTHLKSEDPIPAGLEDFEFQRNDTLFDSVHYGPALRVVVDELDEESMIRFGLWIARLRGWV